MGKSSLVPVVQYKYIEPFKNRAYQYDTAQVNYYMSHYVNQILNVTGDDCIVTGTTVSFEIDSYETGIYFTIKPGGIVQDTTYIEMLEPAKLYLENVTSYPDCWVVIYTDWQYINTPYPNDLKVCCTIYNPATSTTLTEWNHLTNRIILGVFSYDINDGKIVSIDEKHGDLLIDNINLIENGTFDDATLNYWTLCDSSPVVINDGSGYYGTAYIELATPFDIINTGISQCFQTRRNFKYELSFHVKSSTLTPLKLLITNGNDTFDIDAPQIMEMHITPSMTWTRYEFQFSAVSDQSVIFFLKNTSSSNDTIDIDHVRILEKLRIRRISDLKVAKRVDGGLLLSDGHKSYFADLDKPPAAIDDDDDDEDPYADILKNRLTRGIKSNSGRFPKDTHDVVYMVLRYYIVDRIDEETRARLVEYSPDDRLRSYNGVYGAAYAMGFYYPNKINYKESDLMLQDPNTGDFASFPVGYFGDSAILKFSNGFYERGWVRTIENKIVGEQLPDSESFLGAFKNIFPISKMSNEVYNPSTAELDRQVFFLKDTIDEYDGAFWLSRDHVSKAILNLGDSGAITPENQTKITAAIELRVRPLADRCSGMSYPVVGYTTIWNDRENIYLEVFGTPVNDPNGDIMLFTYFFYCPPGAVATRISRMLFSAGPSSRSMPDVAELIEQDVLPVTEKAYNNEASITIPYKCLLKEDHDIAIELECEDMLGYQSPRIVIPYTYIPKWPPTLEIRNISNKPTSLTFTLVGIPFREDVGIVKYFYMIDGAPPVEIVSSKLNEEITIPMTGKIGGDNVTITAWCVDTNDLESDPVTERYEFQLWPPTIEITDMSNTKTSFLFTLVGTPSSDESSIVKYSYSVDGGSPTEVSTSETRKEFTVPISDKKDGDIITVRATCFDNNGLESNPDEKTYSFIKGYKIYPSQAEFVGPADWTSGRDEFVVPNGIKSLRVMLVGGGGKPEGKDGGGGGAAVVFDVAVSPGEKIPISYGGLGSDEDTVFGEYVVAYGGKGKTPGTKYDVKSSKVSNAKIIKSKSNDLYFQPTLESIANEEQGIPLAEAEKLTGYPAKLNTVFPQLAYYYSLNDGLLKDKNSLINYKNPDGSLYLYGKNGENGKDAIYGDSNISGQRGLVGKIFGKVGGNGGNGGNALINCAGKGGIAAQGGFAGYCSGGPGKWVLDPDSVSSGGNGGKGGNGGDGYWFGVRGGNGGEGGAFGLGTIIGSSDIGGHGHSGLSAVKAFSRSAGRGGNGGNGGNGGLGGSGGNGGDGGSYPPPGDNEAELQTIKNLFYAEKEPGYFCFKCNEKYIAGGYALTQPSSLPVSKEEERNKLNGSGGKGGGGCVAIWWN